jgi:hypothetical protein
VSHVVALPISGRQAADSTTGSRIGSRSSFTFGMASVVDVAVTVAIEIRP